MVTYTLTQQSAQKNCLCSNSRQHSMCTNMQSDRHTHMKLVCIREFFSPWNQGYKNLRGYLDISWVKQPAGFCPSIQRLNNPTPCGVAC